MIGHIQIKFNLEWQHNIIHQVINQNIKKLKLLIKIVITIHKNNNLIKKWELKEMQIIFNKD